MSKKFTGILDELYRQQIQAFHHRWVKDYYFIGHFAIFAVLPDSDIIYLSTHPQLSRIYTERKYGLHDHMLSPEMYLNWPFYPWRTGKHSQIINEIHHLREELLNLNSGTNFVRKLSNDESQSFHIIYCISSYKKDPMMYYGFACNVNAILEMFDFAYNSLRHILQSHTERYTLPVIRSFVPFQGGLDVNPFANYQLNNIPKLDMLERSQQLERLNVECEVGFLLKEQAEAAASNGDVSTDNQSASEQTRPHLYLVK